MNWLNYDEILPNLLVGSSVMDEREAELLRREGVTAVLNLQTDDDFRKLGVDWPHLEAVYRRLGVEPVRAPVRDFDPEDLRRKLPECVNALQELLQRGHKVYLHCTEGVGRSPAVAIAHLAWNEGHELNEAERLVRQRRACSPNMEAVRLATADREANR